LQRAGGAERRDGALTVALASTSISNCVPCSVLIVSFIVEPEGGGAVREAKQQQQRTRFLSGQRILGCFWGRPLFLVALAIPARLLRCAVSRTMPASAHGPDRAFEYAELGAGLAG
jgi:hypothetical protein